MYIASSPPPKTRGGGGVEDFGSRDKRILGGLKEKGGVK